MCFMAHLIRSEFKICSESKIFINLIIKDNKLSLVETMYALSHSFLELGVAVLKSEGLSIDLSNGVMAIIDKLEDDYAKNPNPSLGKAIIIQSVALHRIREAFIKIESEDKDGN